MTALLKQARSIENIQIKVQRGQKNWKAEESTRNNVIYSEKIKCI